MTVQSSARAQTKGSTGEASAGKPALAVLFMFCIASPLTITLGGVYFTMARLYCFVLIVPLVIMWLSGRAGRVIATDILLLAYLLWSLLCLLLAQGTSQIVYWISQTIEIFGSYLLARISIRSKADFRKFAIWAVGLGIVLLPFAVFEALTRTQPLRDIAGLLPGFNVVRTVNYEMRLGMTRAQVTFEHPILYGIIIAMLLSLAFVAPCAWGVSKVKRIAAAAGIFLSAFFSLSSGALAVLAVQMIMIGWETALKSIKSRWRILAGLFVGTYVFLELASNRGPIILLISYLTFSSGTGWARILIWQYGTDNLWEHPVFGMGLFSDWARPAWMITSSIDNYWLLIAMRYGIPGVALLLGTIGLACWRIGRLDLTSRPDLVHIRQTYLFTNLAMFVALATVAPWGAAQQFIFFFLGAFLWLLSANSVTSETETLGGGSNTPPRGRRSGKRDRQSRRATAPRYSRFREPSNDDDS